MLATATAELQANPSLLADKTVVLLDIAIGSQAEEAFVHAVIDAAAVGDRHRPVRATRGRSRRFGARITAHPAHRRAGCTALSRLQQLSVCQRSAA